MKLTKNYILTRDETSETGLSVHKRHTYEYVGVIGAPFEGEWGWDYEIEGIDSLTDRIVQLEGAIPYGRSQFVWCSWPTESFLPIRVCEHQFVSSSKTKGMIC